MINPNPSLTWRTAFGLSSIGPSVIIGLQESQSYQRFADRQQEVFNFTTVFAVDLLKRKASYQTVKIIHSLRYRKDIKSSILSHIVVCCCANLVHLFELRLLNSANDAITLEENMSAFRNIISVTNQKETADWLHYGRVRPFILSFYSFSFETTQDTALRPGKPSPTPSRAG